MVNQTQAISGVNGLPPYQYSKVSGVGLVNAASGEYSSGASAGVVQIKITDALNQEVTVSGQIYSLLAVGNNAPSFIIGNSSGISASGGKTPYSYEKISGVGSLSSSTLSSNVAGNAQVKVSDAMGQEVLVNFTVNSNLTLTAGTCENVPEQNDCQFASTGGLGTKSYQSSSGVINSSTGAFYGTCSGITNAFGQAVITVTDAHGNNKTFNHSYPCVFTSCHQIKAEVPSVVSGKFWIDTDADRTGNIPLNVYCDHEQDGGGWNLVAKYGDTSLNSRHWFVMSYGTLSLDDSFPNQMEVASYAARLGARASGIKINYSSNKSNYFTIAQLTADKVNLWNNGSGNYLIGYMGVRPTSGMTESQYNSGQPIRSHIGNYGGTTGSGFTSGLGSNQTLETVSNCTTHCAYRLPGIGTTPGSAWGLQWSPVQAYVKEVYYKHARSCLDAKNRGLVNQAGNMNTGYWTIDTDGFNLGQNPYTVFCDMDLNNGGWTLNYRGDINFSQLTTTSQVINQTIASQATEVMVVYANSSLTYLSTPYKFSKPANFDLWTVNNATVSSSITNLSTGTSAVYNLLYGNDNFGAYTCDAWTPTSEYGRFGICVPAGGLAAQFNDFPFYSGYNYTGVDYCVDATQRYNDLACSNSKFLLMFYR